MVTGGYLLLMKLTSLIAVLELTARADAAVCYKTLGCFDNRWQKDFAFGLFPSRPKSVGTTFRLYTLRNQAGAGELLRYDDNRNMPLAFDPLLPVKVVVHGFSNEAPSWMVKMKDALLQELSCNVILVDWHKGARMPNYLQAVANTQLVGRQIAILLRKLQPSGLRFHSVHLIGMSLGAHVCGFAGSELNGAIGRISGLDPAGPLFENNHPKMRLDSSDAKFVDVIHTNAVPLEKAGFGITKSVGHVDFYPNGGKRQPGCGTFRDFINSIFKKTQPADAVESIGCHHLRSVDLYIESISQSTCHFEAHQCPGGYKDYAKGKCEDCNTFHCSEMGYHSDLYPARGNMYLTTRGSAPYCLIKKTSHT